MTSPPRPAAQPVFSLPEALHALGLDVTYERAEGNRLYCRGADADRAVWDFLGGYGATFFGHNHPALVESLLDFLRRRGVVHGQASTRSASDRLRTALADRLRTAAGRSYRIVLANTGAEAVELGAKHADLAWVRTRDLMAQRLAEPPTHDRMPAWTPEARELLTTLRLWDEEHTLEGLHAYNRSVLAVTPALVAVQGSFHGMTARALELTHDPASRFGARVAPSRVRFVDPRDENALLSALRDLTRPLFCLRARSGVLDVTRVEWTAVSAFFMEPIQGEGGIHPIPAATARAWQQECEARGIPLIADEIQSGMGRTGSFLYSEQLGLRPDYLLLGKSLGGGLAKLSAVAIAAERYLEGFSLQHASTFAEDDLSSEVALRALELLEEERALAQASAKGATLRRALTAVMERHPRVIKDVRGQGLMLAVEWQRQSFDRSNALRLLQHYDWLGATIAGYLLRAHAIRVAPTLSGGTTLRLEPSYSIPDEAVRQLIHGLEELCQLLEREDAAGLLAPCLGIELAPSGSQTSSPAIRRSPSSRSHVAFVGHVIAPDDVALWDPSFSRMGRDGRRAFFDRLRPMAEPLVYHRDDVRSATGEVTTLSFIGLPVTSEAWHGALRSPEQRELCDLVQRAVDMAAGDGCSVVGLGGYCSIVTRNGKSLRPNGIAVTTGNGYTVGAALRAMRRAAEEQAIPWGCSRAAVIGATGNIGAVLAQLLARDVGSLLLVGRASRQPELEALAGRILWSLAEEGAPAGARVGTPHRLASAAPVTLPEAAAHYRRIKCMTGDDCPIDVGVELAACRSAQLIVAASSQPRAILFPEHIGAQPTIICDLAIPGDVDASVARARPNARIIHGGVVHTPANPDWYVPGIPLAPGEMFACMAETVLMGLEGHRSHGSFGSLTAARVRTTIDMARRHGFTTVRTKVESSYRSSAFV